MSVAVPVLATDLGNRTIGFGHDGHPWALDGIHHFDEPVSPQDQVYFFPEELVARLLVDSVVQIESGGQADQVGRQGERGLMQIMEATWIDMTSDLYGDALPFHHAFDPEINRRVGTAYLALLHRFLLAHRNLWRADERSLLLACYNAGPGKVASEGFDVSRLSTATQDYIERACNLHDAYLGEHALMLTSEAEHGIMEIVQLQPEPAS